MAFVFHPTRQGIRACIRERARLRRQARTTAMVIVDVVARSSDVHDPPQSGRGPSSRRLNDIYYYVTEKEGHITLPQLAVVFLSSIRIVRQDRQPTTIGRRVPARRDVDKSNEERQTTRASIARQDNEPRRGASGKDDVGNRRHAARSRPGRECVSKSVELFRLPEEFVHERQRGGVSRHTGYETINGG